MKFFRIKNTVTGDFWSGSSYRQEAWHHIGKLYGEKRNAKAAVSGNELTNVVIVEYEAKEVRVHQC